MATVSNRADSMLGSVGKLLLGKKRHREYQELRFPADKFALLQQNMPTRGSRSLLDIGCNAGVITQAFAEQGFFAVGIDINPKKIDFPSGHMPVTGYYPVTDASLAAVPTFDVILLLSVHHQWVKEHGDAYAQRVLAGIVAKAHHCVFVEFASINQKYGYDPPRFDQTDERDIRRYCEAWLSECRQIRPAQNCDWSFQYIGKNRELAGVEEYRYIYRIDAKS